MHLLEQISAETHSENKTELVKTNPWVVLQERVGASEQEYFLGTERPTEEIKQVEVKPTRPEDHNLSENALWKQNWAFQKNPWVVIQEIVGASER